MNTRLLINLIHFPEQINQDALTDIEKLKNEFPYCSTLQSLYLKGLQNTESIFFEKQLSKASLMANDRSKLYALCYQKKLQTLIEKVEQHTDDLLVTEMEQVPTEIPEPFSILKAEENLGIKEVELIENADEKEIIKLTPRDSQMQALEEDILLEAINNSISQDVDEEIEALNMQEEAEHNLNQHNLLVAQIELPVELPVKEDVENKIQNKPKKLSDWLSVMKPLDEPIEIKKVDDEMRAKPLVSPKELIDKFLKVENKKITVSKEAITPQQMARMSLVENEDFVTETLANIYASQGNFLKSIKIYEQLMLTIPEKKVFFASRIRFLKEKMEYEP